MCWSDSSSFTPQPPVLSLGSCQGKLFWAESTEDFLSIIWNSRCQRCCLIAKIGGAAGLQGCSSAAQLSSAQLSSAQLSSAAAEETLRYSASQRPPSLSPSGLLKTPGQRSPSITRRRLPYGSFWLMGLSRCPQQTLNQQAPGQCFLPFYSWDPKGNTRWGRAPEWK